MWSPGPEPHSSPSRAAFTLLEIVCVLTVIGIVLTMAASAIRGKGRAQSCRAGADGLLQALREARENAVRHGWRTRVVLSLPRTEKSSLPEAELPPQNAFAIFVFHAPVDAAQLATFSAPARLVEVGGGAPSTLSEWVAGGAAALPEGLVGQWRPLPDRPLWTRLADGVQMDGGLLKEYEDLGHEEFAKKHFYHPRACWKATATREQDGWSNRSIFPATYSKTPFPRSFPLISMPVPQTERVHDPSRGATVSARDVWGTQPIPQFLPAVDPAVKQYELPAIEFAPDGSLASTTQKPLFVRFHPVHAPQPAYEVAIDPFDGRATLQSP